MPSKSNRTAYKSDTSFSQRREGLAPALPDSRLLNLLRDHLAIQEQENENFWRDGQILGELWVNSAFTTLTQKATGERHPTPFENSAGGFEDFLHFHGSSLTMADAKKRVEIFDTYFNRDDSTIAALIALGLTKAHKTISYVNEHMSDSEVLKIIDACKAVKTSAVGETLRSLRGGEPLRLTQRAPRERRHRDIGHHPQAVARRVNEDMALLKQAPPSDEMEALMRDIEEHFGFESRDKLLKFLVKDVHKRYLEP